MITLLLKASFALLIFMGFYKLFLEKESFFKANRFYLLGSLLIAFVLPFMALPQLMEEQGGLFRF